ncbi:hypothetical protein JQC92_02490 [Shewanella sp. 202IG2-18]|uniref:hypothetical protein n=1 Tax=Parashewanella hymeniacidonis TaxID=2807618 RepID=UPI0019606BDF|nr:hypothetical protein [Parashewanella hymeniacidonis]MBM7070910.1 hypothetical protein [Parashewanella hymeniacidonis]
MFNSPEQVANMLASKVVVGMTQKPSEDYIEAKADWIVSELEEGREVEGHSLDSIIEEILVDAHLVVKYAYIDGSKLNPMTVLIDKAIIRIADKLAPKLAQQDMENAA